MSSVYTGSDTFHGAGITIPSDGDARNAASVNVPFEALEDDVTYLNNRIGTYRLFALTRTTNDETIGSESNATFGTGVTGVASYTNMFGLASVSVAVGDILDMTTTFNVLLHPNAGSPMFARVFVNQNGGGYAGVAGAAVSLSVLAENPGSDPIKSFCIQSYFAITTAGPMLAALFARAPTAGQSIQLVGELSHVTRVWRPN